MPYKPRYTPEPELPPVNQTEFPLPADQVITLTPPVLPQTFPLPAGQVTTLTPPALPQTFPLPATQVEQLKPAKPDDSYIRDGVAPDIKATVEPNGAVNEVAAHDRRVLNTLKDVLDAIRSLAGEPETEGLETRRPSADFYLEWDQSHPGEGEPESIHFDKVNEDSPDLDISWIGSSVPDQLDVFLLTPSEIPVGAIIDWVRFCCWARSFTPEGDAIGFHFRDGVNVHDLDKTPLSGEEWDEIISPQLVSNPATEASWTEQQIRSLKAGLRSRAQSPYGGVLCSQFFVEVKWHMPEPE